MIFSLNKKKYVPSLTANNHFSLAHTHNTTTAIPLFLKTKRHAPFLPILKKNHLSHSLTARPRPRHNPSLSPCQGGAAAMSPPCCLPSTALGSAHTLLSLPPPIPSMASFVLSTPRHGVANTSGATSSRIRPGGAEGLTVIHSQSPSGFG